MTLTGENLQSLLNQEEGPALDFKRDQYRFSGESVRDKSELLKDILAFANSERSHSAHILIGVEEANGRGGEVVGVESHLDDANLHQFVNEKTNRPVEFTYSAHSLQGRSVGLISVPIQKRPVWAKKRYGVVGAGEVYVRDGSSTRTATPDEIAAMGRGNPPRLRAEWGDASRRTVYPFDYVHRSTGLKLPDRFHTWLGNHGEYDFEALAKTLGKDPTVYDGPMFTLVRKRAMGRPLGLRFLNGSGSTAENVGFTATLQGVWEMRLESGATGHAYPKATGHLSRQADREILCDPSGDGIEIAVELGRIRPGEYIWAGRDARLVTRDSGTSIWEARFVADNLPEPIESLLCLKVEYEEREIQSHDLECRQELHDPLWLP